MATIEERHTKSGKVRYRALVRRRGHSPQSSTFERKTDARRWAKGIEAAIDEGRHFKAAQSKKHTLAELIDVYIRDVLPRKPRSLELQRHQLLWWRQILGHHVLVNLGPGILASARDKLANQTLRDGRKRSPATINRYLAALSHVFTVAVREWEWMSDNPMRLVGKFPEPKGRVRHLSDPELARLLEAVVVAEIRTCIRLWSLLSQPACERQRC